MNKQYFALWLQEDRQLFCGLFKPDTLNSLPGSHIWHEGIKGLEKPDLILRGWYNGIILEVLERQRKTCNFTLLQREDDEWQKGCIIGEYRYLYYRMNELLFSTDEDQSIWYCFKAISDSALFSEYDGLCLT